MTTPPEMTDDIQARLEKCEQLLDDVHAALLSILGKPRLLRAVVTETRDLLWKLNDYFKERERGQYDRQSGAR